MSELYIAEVIENDSSKSNGDNKSKDGRVQIYIEWLHRDIAKADLPWAKPDREWTSNIPEKGEKLWIFFEDEKNWRHPFYKNKLNLKGYNNDNHNKTIGQMTAEYPNVKYILLKNGIAIALSSDPDKAEISIYHPSAEFYIDKDGNIDIKNNAGNEIKMNDNGIDIKDKQDNDIKMEATGITIKDKNSNEIQMTATGITLKTGDATTWQPNFLGNCIFSSAPHGGSVAGIIKLKGA